MHMVRSKAPNPYLGCMANIWGVCHLSMHHASMRSMQKKNTIKLQDKREEGKVPASGKGGNGMRILGIHTTQGLHVLCALK